MFGESFESVHSIEEIDCKHHTEIDGFSVGTVVMVTACCYGETVSLYTVTDENELAAVDVDNGCSATIIGKTKDWSGVVYPIRGLAYVDDLAIPGGMTVDTLFGMTRDGDLVAVDRGTAATYPLWPFVAPPLSGEFWGGLAFNETARLLYTADAFEPNHLVEIEIDITAFPPLKTYIKGSTVYGGNLPLQILGQAFYPLSAPVVPPTFNGIHPALDVLYGSNRNNDNIVVIDTDTGDVTFPMGNHTVGVNNLQAITFHPHTGVLYAIHDHFSASNNAAISTYDFTAEMATELCELPFGIVETVGGGADTYGWGGLAFAPSCRIDGIVDFINGLDTSLFCGSGVHQQENNKEWFLNQLEGIDCKKNKFVALIRKADGCPPAPDTNDKLCDCAAQAKLAALIAVFLDTGCCGE